MSIRVLGSRWDRRGDSGEKEGTEGEHIAFDRIVVTAWRREFLLHSYSHLALKPYISPMTKDMRQSHPHVKASVECHVMGEPRSNALLSLFVYFDPALTLQKTPGKWTNGQVHQW
jgi:hypothetical protein